MRGNQKLRFLTPRDEKKPQVLSYALKKPASLVLSNRWGGITFKFFGRSHLFDGFEIQCEL